MKKPLVSLITLNYNRQDMVQETLKSLENQTYSNKEVIMIDVCSVDKSVELVRKKFPKVWIVELKKNLGVAGYNEAMKLAKGDYFILVDSDAEIQMEATSRIVEIFQKTDTGLIAFKILDHKTGKMIDNPGHAPRGSKESGYEIGFLNSAALALRRGVFQKTHGFNPEYFVYLIEMDFCERAILKGFKIKYFPELFVRHKFGPSNTRNKAKYYVSRNWVYFIVQYLPLWIVPVFFAWSVFKVFYDTSHGYGRAGSYIQGLLSGLKKTPYYWKKRKVLTTNQLLLFMRTQFMAGGFTNKW